MMKPVYKIQRKDGQFSKGSYRPTFNSTGKTWSTVSQLKQHLRAVSILTTLKVYQECTVVEYYPVPEKTMSVMDFKQIHKIQGA